MFIKKTRKKESEASRVEEENSMDQSYSSNFNTDSYRRGRDLGRQGFNFKGDLDVSSTNNSHYREVLYLDPTDNLRRHPNMSPVTEGRQANFNSNRSPKTLGQSVISSVRKDLNERLDTAQLIGKKPIPTLTVSIPFKKDDTVHFDRERHRSPKVINLAGGINESDYLTRTLHQRRSPKETHNLNFPFGMNSLNGHESHGNLLLDQPVNVLG